MPPIKTDRATLVRKAIAEIKRTGERPIQVAEDLVATNFENLSADDKRWLCAYGLARLVSDTMQEERQAASQEGAISDPNGAASNSTAQPRLDPSKIQYPSLLNYRKRREYIELLSARKEADPKGKKLRDRVKQLHARCHGGVRCTRKGCTNALTTNHSYRELAECLSTTLRKNIEELLSLNETEQDKLVKTHLESVKNIERLKVEEEESKKWYDYLHTLSKCRNGSCRRGEYSKGRYGNCAYWFFYHYKTRELQEQEAIAVGKSNDAVRKAHYDRISMWVDMAINEGYQNAMEDMKSITLLASDGTMKNLAMFNMEDLTEWTSKAQSHVDGWQDRMAWFDMAASYLSKNPTAATLADLPAEDFQALGKAAAIVWKDTKPEEDSNDSSKGSVR